MRLTADLVANSRIFINCLNERELDLHGYKIPAIENLGACNNQVDAINLSHNEIKTVDEIPGLTRLLSLSLVNNQINRIDSCLGKKAPNLKVLMLTNNRIRFLSEIKELSTCKQLETLSLVNNPVISRPHYRLYTIHTIQSLKVLDFCKVKDSERKAAQALFSSAEGKDILSKSALAPERSLQRSRKLTAQQEANIRSAIANAQTPEEVDRLGQMLKAGVFLGDASMSSSIASPPAANVPPPPPALPAAVPSGLQEGGTAVADPTPAPASATENKSASVAPVTAPEADDTWLVVEQADAIEAEAPQNTEAPMELEPTPEASAQVTQQQASIDGADEMQTSPPSAPEESGEEAASAVSVGQENPPADLEWIDDLKVAELRKELKKRGADTKGLKLKKDLQKKLREVCSA